MECVQYLAQTSLTSECCCRNQSRAQLSGSQVQSHPHNPQTPEILETISVIAVVCLNQSPIQGRPLIKADL